MKLQLAKQTEIRSNMKKYLDMASDGTAVLVPRIAGRNVVILSEQIYQKLMEDSERLQNRNSRQNNRTERYQEKRGN